MGEFILSIYDWAFELLVDIGMPSPRHVLNSLLFVLGYVLVRRFVVLPVSRRLGQAETRYSFRKVTNAVLTVFLIGLLAFEWFETKDPDKLLAPLGLFAAGLAVALAPPLLNFFGWLFILVRTPFSLQDRIAIGDEVRGDVIDIRLFMFSVLEVGGWVDADQSTGRILHIPNSVVFTKNIGNFTQGFSYIWNEVPVCVTFESNWEKAHEILTKIVTEMTAEMSADAQRQVRETSTKFMVYYRRFTPIVWVAVIDIGVNLTLRYLCDPRRRRSSEHEIWKAILTAFGREPDIDFAYPTQRFYDNAREGKPLAGGPPITSEPMLPTPPPLMTQAIDISEPVGPPTGASDSAAEILVDDEEADAVDELDESDEVEADDADSVEIVEASGIDEPDEPA